MTQGFSQNKPKKNKKAVHQSNNSQVLEQFKLGVKYYQSGQLQQAATCFQQVIEKEPNQAEAWYLLGIIAAQNHQYATAIQQIGQAIELKPDYHEAYFSLGNIYYTQKQLSEAIAVYEKLIQLQPGNVVAYSNLGVFYIEQKQVNKAINCFQKAIEFKPDYVEAYNNLGNLYQELGLTSNAIECFQKAINLNPNYVEAHNNLGLAYTRQNNLEAAINSFNNALQLKPDNANAYYQLGWIYKEQEKIPEAIKCFQQAIDINPNYAEAYNNLGYLYRKQNNLDKAQTCFQRAIELQPNFASVYNNLGLLLQEQYQFNQAEKYFLQAIKLQSNFAEAWGNLSLNYKWQGKLSQAIQCCQQALQLKPDYEEVYNRLGNIYTDQGKSSQAMQCYQQALQIKPNYEDANYNLLFCLHYSDKYEPLYIYTKHQEWGEKYTRITPNLVYSNEPNPDKRLRIGYVSGDLKTHSVTYFFEPILAHYNRKHFEIICYANNKKTDATTERLKQLADDWRDIYNLNNEEVASLICADEIDILVDLSGHTSGNRLLFFTHKPAPIQVTYLGYPDTTGLKTIDYRLTDNWADPQGETDALHTEQLVRLPHGFLCYQPPIDCPQIEPPPVLKKGQITFGCFNNPAKITPQLISYWAAILKALPKSRLILKSKPFNDISTKEYFQELFKQNGIELERIDLLGWIDGTQEHLNFYHQIDIALDTFPYNGTTTTCEALLMGVPVITLAGKTHVSRVGVSLLTSVGLTEFMAQSAEDYIQKAVNLANDQQRLQQLRRDIPKQIQSAPLTNATLITQSLEDAYRNMWRNWCNTQNSGEGSSQEVQSLQIIGDRKDKKIISFALWGDTLKYTLGAIKNADLASVVYPGWICRFYVASTVPQDIHYRSIISPRTSRSS